MFKIIDSEEVAYRCDFALLCNRRGVRLALEIGTDRGEFAVEFMKRFNGEQLFCVDPYEHCKDMPGGRMPDMLMAVVALQQWHGKVRIVQLTSTQYSEQLPKWVKDRIDFVYIDGDHDYLSVLDDLERWWDILSPDGILAGHDFDDSHPGVKQAVTRFAVERSLVVRLLKADHLPSWYIYKNEPPILFKEFFDAGELPNPEYLI